MPISNGAVGQFVDAGAVEPPMPPSIESINPEHGTTGKFVVVVVLPTKKAYSGSPLTELNKLHVVTGPMVDENTMTTLHFNEAKALPGSVVQTIPLALSDAGTRRSVMLKVITQQAMQAVAAYCE